LQCVDIQDAATLQKKWMAPGKKEKKSTNLSSHRLKEFQGGVDLLA
jgi:hypothetical protein